MSRSFVVPIPRPVPPCARSSRRICRTPQSTARAAMLESGHRTTSPPPLAIRGRPSSRSRLKIARSAPIRPTISASSSGPATRLETDDEPSPAGIQVEQRREAMAIARPRVQPDGRTPSAMKPSIESADREARPRSRRDRRGKGHPVPRPSRSATARCDRGATRLPNAPERLIMIPTTADGMDGHASLQVDDRYDAEAHGRDHLSKPTPTILVHEWVTGGGLAGTPLPAVLGRRGSRHAPGDRAEFAALTWRTLPGRRDARRPLRRRSRPVDGRADRSRVDIRIACSPGLARPILPC